MKHIDYEDLSMTDEYVYTYLDQPFTGMATRHYEGYILSEKRFLNGKMHGICRSWHLETDQIKTEGLFKGNVLHGINQEWYENGVRKRLTQCELGIQLKQVTWNQFEEIVEIYLLDKADTFYSILCSSRTLDAGKPDPEAGPEQAELLAELDRILEENGYFPEEF